MTCYLLLLQMLIEIHDNEHKKEEILRNFQEHFEMSTFELSDMARIFKEYDVDDNAYIAMAYIIVAYIAMADIIVAYIAMADIIVAYIGMAYIGMAYVVMAYIVMAYMDMAYIVMAYIGMMSMTTAQ